MPPDTLADVPLLTSAYQYKIVADHSATRHQVLRHKLMKETVRKDHGRGKATIALSPNRSA
jgi:hypothetical protein